MISGLFDKLDKEIAIVDKFMCTEACPCYNGYTYDRPEAAYESLSEDKLNQFDRTNYKAGY